MRQVPMFDPTPFPHDTLVRQDGPHAHAGKLERVAYDLATLEGAGGVANVLEHLPPERLLFGSHAPLFYPEAAAMKMRESTLAPAVAEQILTGNAERLLRK